MERSGIGRSGSVRRFLAGLLGVTGALKPYDTSAKHFYSDTAFQPLRKGVRNQKPWNKVRSIERRRKAKKLHNLSKAKRRKIYYYNLRHPYSRMYA